MSEAQSTCPRCGEPNDTHTWFGRVVDNPLTWHRHVAAESPSELEAIVTAVTTVA